MATFITNIKFSQQGIKDIDMVPSPTRETSSPPIEMCFMVM